MAKQTMEQFQAKLKRWAKAFPKAVEKGLKSIRPTIVTDIQQNYLSGQVLGVRSGTLRSSIRGDLRGGKEPSLRIGTDVDYGAVWFARGKDFIRPSMRSNLPKLCRLVKDNIMSEYKEAV